jgi:hypothetical protein
MHTRTHALPECQTKPVSALKCTQAKTISQSPKQPQATPATQWNLKTNILKGAQRNQENHHQNDWCPNKEPDTSAMCPHCKRDVPSV